MYKLTDPHFKDIFQNQNEICFYDALIVKDSYSKPIKNGAIVVSKNIIKDIGTSAQMLKKYPNALLINTKNFMIAPGLINSHTHVAMGFFRGLGHDYLHLKKNSSIIETLMFPLEKSLTPALVETLSYSYIYEGIKSGTTCFVDHYYFIDAVAKALKTFGARGIVGETLADLGGAFPSDTKFKEVTRSIENWKWDPLILPALAPHATDTVSSNLLKNIVKFAKQYDLPIHIHLSQTTGEKLRVLKREKMTPVKYAYMCGALSHKTLAVHLVSANEEDFKLLSNTNTTVVLCPISEIIYAQLPDLQKIFKLKLPVAVGTDCAASNDGADILNELKFFNLICKHLKIPANILKHENFLNMITTIPAKALGINKIGSLNKGNYADLIFIKQDLHTQPCFNPITNLLYSPLSKTISHVMIDGKWVLYNFEFVNLCTKTIMDNYMQSLDIICKKAKIKKRTLI